MKKRMIFCTLLFCTTLACTACQAAVPEASGSDTPQEMEDNISGTQQTPDTAADADTEDTEETEENADQRTDSDISTDETASDSSETDTTVSTFPSGIRIEMHTEEEKKTADDGTVYLTKSYTIPAVFIEGNDDAAQKINTDIQSRLASFLASTGTEQWAIEDYEYKVENFPDDTFFAYSEDLSFKTERADTNVISFTMSNYAYTGGAHGNSDTIGINYNAKTGELISFSELSEDAAAFHEDTLAYNQTLARTDSYKERMFSPESVTDGTLESVLYADDVWYLSTSGLVFMSAPYALGPYAAGTIAFVIPYTDLSGMGFKTSYTYADRFLMNLQEKEPYSFDLNGDKDADSIQFQSEYIENEDGTYGSLLHLTVNETDFSQSGDDVVREYLSTISWGEFFLYDMNVDDSYTELVVLSGENEADDYVYYSHLFRYTADGRLLYLGKIKGDVSDPTVELTVIN